MSEIPNQVHASAVTSLDMTRNSIQVLSSTSLSSFPNLVDLKIRENLLQTISIGTFLNLNSLQTLDLSSNNLTTLEPDVFRDAVKLVHLDLSNNQLTAIDKAFNGLTELSRLDLRQNLLTSITQLTFRGLTQLRYLRLDDNMITNVDQKAFADLDKLMYFVLKGNQIGHLEAFYFSSQFLSYVDLSECDLTRVPKGLPSSVRYLQLRRNKMAVLPRDSFASCVDVTIIVLDENDVIEIEEGAFEHLDRLQQLWLNGNRLEYVPKPIPPSVQRLFLDSNQLQSLAEDDFPRDSQLNTLSLMGNNISYIDSSAFHRLLNLKSIDLSGNQIRRIYAHTFSRSSQLQVLQLSKNLLENLESGSFHGLTDLRTLSMAYVPTDAFVHPDAFRDLVTLRKLDLDSSSGLLSSILDTDEILSALSSVQDLSLLNAELTTLRSDLPDFFPYLAVLHISGSAWHCDSNLIWFRNWLLSAPIHIEHRDRNRCMTPRTVYDRAVTSLSDADFLPAPNSPVRYTTLRLASGPRETVKPSGHRVTSLHAKTYSTANIVQMGNDNRNEHFASASRPWYGVTSSSYAVDRNGKKTNTQKPGRRAMVSMTTTSKVESDADILTWDEILSRMSQRDYDGQLFDASRHLDLFSPLLRDELSSEPLSKTPASTTSADFNSKFITSRSSGISASNVSRGETGLNVITLTAVTVIMTVVIAAVLVAFIVCLCRKRKSAKRCPENGLPAQNGVKTSAKKDVLYFMTPTSSKHGDLGKPKAVLAPENTAEVMTLIPGRDINHEGPMRVYKWEDF